MRRFPSLSQLLDDATTPCMRREDRTGTGSPERWNARKSHLQSDNFQVTSSEPLIVFFPLVPALVHHIAAPGAPHDLSHSPQEQTCTWIRRLGD